MKRIVLLVLLALSVGAAAQQGTVRGRVVDAKSGDNIEYATVALLSPKDSTLKGGTVSEANGSFRIEAPYGTYLMRITFIGYEPQYYSGRIVLSADHSNVNLGKIQIKVHADIAVKR